jgi:hypothetical protein
MSCSHFLQNRPKSTDSSPDKKCVGIPAVRQLFLQLFNISVFFPSSFNNQLILAAFRIFPAVVAFPPGQVIRLFPVTKQYGKVVSPPLITVFLSIRYHYGEAKITEYKNVHR